MGSIRRRELETDVLVVGAGGAGCFAALTAAERGARVLVLNKLPWLGGCTLIARAGYAAAMDGGDSVAGHVRDTVVGGDYLGHQRLLKALWERNGEATRALLAWGAAFRRGPDGRLDLGKKPAAGHSHPRSVRVAGDLSHIGKVIMAVLQRRMRERGIGVLGNVMVTRLLTGGEGAAGALGFDWRAGTLLTVRAGAVVMATGGTGQLYRYTDNPVYMTGDGHAVMAAAGAELTDMEFCDFQLAVFHPPGLFGYPPNATGWITAGAVLRNGLGERFFKTYCPDREHEAACLRTELNRAAAEEILAGRGSASGMVLLDCAAVPREWMLTARADMVSHFRRAGIDLTCQPLEVAPANHTWLGGLRVDERAESTTLPGLFAAGEAAAGWGGSNRLGGNALAAALGSGILAGEAAAARSRPVRRGPLPEDPAAAEAARLDALLERTGGVKAAAVRERVQALVQAHLWLRRDARGIGLVREALREIAAETLPALAVPRRGPATMRLLGLRQALETENLVRCGELVAAAALTRTESRGSHQRADFPALDNRRWLRNVILRRDGEGALHVRTEPVAATEIPLPSPEPAGKQRNGKG